MRWSRFMLPTVKEAPAEAEVVSHQLMLRAGMIRKVAAGIYHYLPLGLRSIRKLENIIREEMDRAGFHELLMPAIQPAELWEESGRWEIYGKELLRIKDRHERDFCFGPTHEEVITDLCRKEIQSYRDLPLGLYQIQSKFRDEIRPRFGLMRGREFIMKDAYSFHTDAKEAVEGRLGYWEMYDVYRRIFERCGLDFRAVEAVTGNIGGSLSHEFQVLAESGEDLILSCDQCDYAANIEKAVMGSSQSEQDERSQKWKQEPSSNTKPETVSTPQCRTIEEVSQFLKVEPADIIKTMLFHTSSGMVACCLLGCDELHEGRLQEALGIDEMRMAEPQEIVKATGGPPGFSGPIGLSIPLYVDFEVDPEKDYVCGANEKDMHFRGVIPSEHIQAKPISIRKARVGDSCPKDCQGSLHSFRGIEVGQVFFLGNKYSTSMGAKYLSDEGSEKIMEMGCYGIGVGRTLAAAIEQNHDEHGISFPLPLAPFQVILISLAGKNEEVAQEADKIYDELVKSGIEVLYDDRNARPGVKFKDADLIGVPIQITLGKKSLDEGKVELKMRKGSESHKIPVAELAASLHQLLDQQIHQPVGQPSHVG